MGQSEAFERVRASIAELPLPPEEGDRRVHWVVKGRLGIARDHAGGFEIFLGGERLSPTSSLVARHLAFDAWKAEGGDIIHANRVVLPPEDHFLGISSLIAAECIQEGIDDPAAEVQAVFEKVEPILELALKRLALSDEAMLGLIGELLLLEQLLLACGDAPERRSDALDMWQGHGRAPRDFKVGRTGIEVKVTTTSTSSHMIHGLGQVEPTALPGGQMEEDVLLLSIGLEPAPSGPLSLPGQVDRVLGLLGSGLPGTETTLQLRLLELIGRYGGLGTRGYDHAAMRDRMPYSRRFATTFAPRLYDLLDPEVKLLRSQDLEGLHVSRQHLEYQADLPSRVSDQNPAKDWAAFAKAACRKALGLAP